MNEPLALLRPFHIALAIALCATLFGHGIGIAFGVAEDSIKGSLQAGADAVLADKYGGDAAKAKSVVDKSFTYVKRAHMHAGALGTGALVLALVLAFLGAPALRFRQAVAVASSIGALGYGLYWLLAAFAAPGLGGTGAAKEAYAWIGLPTSALVVAGTVGGLVCVVLSIVSARRGAS
jgi:hypothetical protein